MAGVEQRPPSPEPSEPSAQQAVRVAAIDCGTNSLRLLVADVSAPGQGGASLVDVERTMEVVRLGEGVDATGAFTPAALERTLAATDRCAARITEHGAQRVRFVATSASRDASNAALLLDGVRQRLGVEAEVITGEEEAALSFAGATTGLSGGSPHGASGSSGGSSGGAAHLVMDLGGGSTEMVLGSPGAQGLSAVSMDVGSVRLTERHALSDPPTRSQVAEVRATVRAALAAAADAVPLRDVEVAVGVAGTVTTVAAHVLRLPAYDPASLHGAVLPIADVLVACEDLVAMTRAQRASLPYLHPGRVDVIGAGAILWAQVLEALRSAGGVTEVAISEHDILDGIALRLGAPAPDGSPTQA